MECKTLKVKFKCWSADDCCKFLAPTFNKHFGVKSTTDFPLLLLHLSMAQVTHAINPAFLSSSVKSFVRKQAAMS